MKNCKKVNYPKLNHDGYTKFLTQSKLEPLLVPVRMRGLTSSGIKNYCYYNVANMVEMFGGKVVLGWSVFNFGSTLSQTQEGYNVTNMVRLFGHAMWLNAEQKLSDPTAKSWMIDADLLAKESDLWRFVWENDNAYVQFIPLLETEVVAAFQPLSVDIEKVVSIDGKTIKDWTVYVHDEKTPRRELSWQKIRTNNKFFNFMTWTAMDANFINKEADKLCRHALGVFSEKSTATGLFLDEIRADRMVRARTLADSLIANYQ